MILSKSYGLASFLKEIKELKLSFGGGKFADPWYLKRRRTGVDAVDSWKSTCVGGKLVDWILTFAWFHGHLQHIEKIQLEGVQDWVEEKWSQVFARKHPNQAFIGSHADVWNAAHVGLSQSELTGNQWNAQDFYPPRCECDVPCSELAKLVIKRGCVAGNW
ncbi:hypothetical protein P280DRAFT_256386 [Massarina eburnea CBS 473.64]|uniref:Uncharacterized protein n=1 Tax=Massarina eburnea CBS 473.64 TaxID=1395130 RepID=A0A6A6S6V4_9PLEO|nr:hypothetical protein P280DRAFT_256386 [Massarina eburnea CBS 473.64]